MYLVDHVILHYQLFNKIDKVYRDIDTATIKSEKTSVCHERASLIFP